MRSGNYGLYVVGYIDVNEHSSPAAAIKLDSNAMFGNPYAYIAPFSQEILFKYNIPRDFERLDFYLYQQNNFTYFDTHT
jgi:hypothetical protein